MTYYAPAVLGVVVVLLMNPTIRAGRPSWAAGMEWPFLVLAAVGAGLLCQAVMFGVQGALAQVIPAPGGRTVRGRGAVLIGACVLLAVAASLAAALFASEGMTALTAWTWVVAGAAMLAAGATYAWQWPAADRDFADQR